MNWLEIYLQLSLGIGIHTKKCREICKPMEAVGALEYKGNLCFLKKDFRIASYECRYKNTGELKILGSNESLKFHSNAYFDQDILLVQQKTYKKHQTRIKVLALLSRSPLKLCYLDKFKGQIVGVLVESLKHIRLNIKQKALAQLPRFCVIYVNTMSGEIEKILGVLDEERVDLPMFLLSRGIHEEFPLDVEEFANSFGKEVDPTFYPDRQDLSHLPFCTIDPVNAKDFDDAIYYDHKKRVLYVAIADVSEYVSKNTPLDLEARNRAFSIYFPHCCIPMLPKNLSENLCSLRPSVIRLAYVWKISFTQDYEVRQSELFEALIKSRASLDYESVHKFLCAENLKASQGIPKELHRSLKEFYKVAMKIREKRAHGALMLDSCEIRLELDEQSALEAVYTEYQNEAQKLVEEAMLLANVEAARALDSQEGIYRVHQSMNELKKQRLLKDLSELGFEIQGKSDSQKIHYIQEEAKRRDCLQEVNAMIIRAQSRAMYSSLLDSHFGLNFKQYTHFTSPIRRYSDLFLHRLLKAKSSHNRQIDYVMSEARGLCAYLNIQERNISRLEMDFCDRKMARYASKNLGLEVLAIVIDDRSMLATGLENFIFTRLFLRDVPEDIKLLDKIRVRILEVNILKNQIFAEFLARVSADVRAVSKENHRLQVQSKRNKKPRLKRDG